MTKNSLFIAGAFLAGGALGAVAGAKIVEKRLTEEFNSAVDAERAAARALYGKPAENQQFASPQEAVEELILPEVAEEALKSYRGKPSEPIAYHKIKPSSMKFEKEAVPEKPAPIQEDNIFAANEEIGEISLISLLDFSSGESGYETTSLNYYAGDKVLSTLEDEKIEDVDGTIGPDALEHFGMLSDDPNVVYVRNKKLQIDFEVLRNDGAWIEEAHGLTPAGDRPSQSGG